MRVPSIVVSLVLVVSAGVSLAPSAVASREVVAYLTASGFSPGSMSVVIGDRIRFTVRDRKPHQIAKTSGPASGDVPPNVLERQGDSVTLVPDEPGTYSYIDRLNPRSPEFRLTVRR